MVGRRSGSRALLAALQREFKGNAISREEDEH